jgi:hypothetical protein
MGIIGSLLIAQEFPTYIFNRRIITSTTEGSTIGNTKDYVEYA